MTAGRRAAGRRRRRRGGSGVTGTGGLLRLQLRRDRVRLPLWVAGFAAFTLYLTLAIPEVYGVEEELASASQLIGGPLGRLLTGPGYGLDEVTLARFITSGYGLYFLLLAALMNILLLTRHTRLEEQTGRAELLRAGVVGRHAPLTAALLLALLTNVAAAAAVLLAFTATVQAHLDGALLFAAAIAVTGVTFAGVAALTAQIGGTSRSAAGLAGLVLGAAFLLRAVGDAVEIGGSALSWSNPLGWAQQTAPYVLDRWWPLALSLGVAAGAAAAALSIQSRRDLGVGLLEPRPGPGRAALWLGSPLTLAWRQQRAALLGWCAALAAAGLAFGGFADLMLTAAADLPEALIEVIGGEQDLLDGYTSFMALYVGLIVAVYAVLAVTGLRSEEVRGRLEPVLATAVSRPAWLAAHLTVIAGAVLVILTVAGFALGLGTAAVTGDGEQVALLTAAHLNVAPAVLVVLGVAVLAFGAAPRLIGVGWAVIGFGLAESFFGDLLDLPEPLLAASPFFHAARVPAEPFAAAPLWGLTAVAGALGLLALLAFRHRPIDSR